MHGTVVYIYISLNIRIINWNTLPLVQRDVAKRRTIPERGWLRVSTPPKEKTHVDNPQVAEGNTLIKQEQFPNSLPIDSYRYTQIIKNPHKTYFPL